MDDDDDDDDDNEEMLVEKIVTPPRSERLAFSYSSPSPTTNNNVDFAPVDLEPAKELSMIAEDDEGAERSRSSIAKPRESTSKPRSSEPALPMPEREAPSRDKSGKHAPLKPPPNLNMMAIMDIEDMTTTFTASTSGSTQTFHSITLDSPSVGRQDSQPPPPTEDHNDQALDERKQTSLVGSEYSKTEVQATSTPFRVVTPEGPAQVNISPKHATTKPGIPHFPTIGAPSPLRKSMRAPREPSMTVNHPAPGQKQGLTRSSWLVKAREAKALEESAKRSEHVWSCPCLAGGHG